ncbi:hypothetical protein ACFT5B_14970 [Luteimicrobium sp. NPDC057192]|uniref:hypothetical protein n=1 Tax=Luteimicrobium sp. NPDC057192 TaxID=3346042 RepID=UPI0036336CFB
MPAAFWVCGLVTLVSAAVSLGYSIAALRAADAPGERLASRYAAARSVALASVAVVALFSGSEGFVVAVGLAMVVVQALDAIVGSTIPDRLKTVGPAATAVVNAAAVVWLLAS